MKLPCRKLSPTFIRPFRIQQLCGPNAVFDRRVYLRKPKPGKKPVKDKLDRFFGLQGQFSAIAQRAQRAIALEDSDHDNTPVLSTVSDVSASSGSGLTRVPQRFKPT